jgi:hypothetical protein
MPLAQKISAYRSWANTPNRTARTANARKALEQKFLDRAGGDVLAAQAIRKIYFLELAQKSAAARKARKAAEQSEREARIAKLIAEYDARVGGDDA